MGRHSTGKVPAQPLREIKTRHREMMYMLLAGMTGVQISAQLNISQSRLSIIRNSPIFQAELSKLETKLEAKTIEKKSDLNAKVIALQGKSLDVMENMLDDVDTPDPMKQSICKDIFDLGELKSKNKNKVSDSGGTDFFTQLLQASLDKAQEERKEQLKEQLEEQKSLTNGRESHSAIDIDAKPIT